MTTTRIDVARHQGGRVERTSEQLSELGAHLAASCWARGLGHVGRGTQLADLARASSIRSTATSATPRSATGEPALR